MRRWTPTVGVMTLVIAVACSSPSMGDDDPEADVTVTVSGRGDGDGWVRAPDPQVLIDCHLTYPHDDQLLGCSAQFDDAGLGGSFVLSAIADPGHLFAGWGPTGGCTGPTPTCQLRFTSTPTTLHATANFLRIPERIQVDVADGSMEVGQHTTATATATADPPLPDTAAFSWTSSDPAVATVTPGTPAHTATVAAVGPGTAEITAEARTRTSEAVTVTVTDGSVPATYSLTPFVSVANPVEIDFDANGNLFVANNGGPDPVSVRRITPDGEVSDFGDSIIDPDALIVDKLGAVSGLGEGAVLVAGARDSQYSENHITEIGDDGTTQVLFESAPPGLSNPSSFAFLSNGDLLVGNYGNNTVSRLRKDNSGTLQLEVFYEDAAAANGLWWMVSLNTVVYVVSGSKKLTALSETGELTAEDLWPATESSDPGALAIDVFGNFGGDLLVAGSDGRIRRLDPESDDWHLVGEFVFDEPIFGMAVSPLDGALYVAERSGQIWKVAKE